MSKKKKKKKRKEKKPFYRSGESKLIDWSFELANAGKVCSHFIFRPFTARKHNHFEDFVFVVPVLLQSFRADQPVRYCLHYAVSSRPILPALCSRYGWIVLSDTASTEVLKG